MEDHYKRMMAGFSTYSQPPTKPKRGGDAGASDDEQAGGANASFDGQQNPNASVAAAEVDEELEGGEPQNGPVVASRPRRLSGGAQEVEEALEGARKKAAPAAVAFSQVDDQVVTHVGSWRAVRA